MSHVIRHRVRFGDVDHAGLVYYPRLAHYTHLALEDFFDRHVGLRYVAVLDEHRLGLPTVHLDMAFHRPLRYGDDVEIRTTLLTLGTTSLTWRHELTRVGDEEPSAVATIVTVCMDLDAYDKTPVPPFLRRALAPLMNDGTGDDG